MIWPAHKQMSPATAQALIDALLDYQIKPHSHFQDAARHDNANKAIADAMAEAGQGYPPLNNSGSFKGAKDFPFPLPGGMKVVDGMLRTDTIRAPYDGAWRPEGSGYSLVEQLREQAKTVDKLAKELQDVCETRSSDVAKFNALVSRMGKAENDIDILEKMVYGLTPKLEVVSNAKFGDPND